MTDQNKNKVITFIQQGEGENKVPSEVIKAATDYLEDRDFNGYSAIVSTYANGEFGGCEDHGDWALVTIPLSSMAIVEKYQSFIDSLPKTKMNGYLIPNVPTSGTESCIDGIQAFYFNDDGTEYDDVTMEYIPKLRMYAQGLSLVHSCKHTDLEVVTDTFSIPDGFMQAKFKEIAGQYNTTAATVAVLLGDTALEPGSSRFTDALIPVPEDKLSVADNYGVILTTMSTEPETELFTDMLSYELDDEDFETLFGEALGYMSPDGGNCGSQEAIELASESVGIELVESSGPSLG